MTTRRANPTDEAYLYSDLTRRVIGAALAVHSQLGPGFLERVYEGALAIEFDCQAIPFERQAVFAIRYRDRVVGNYAADLVVDGKIILETKAIDDLAKPRRAQLLNYLRATGLRIGLLINFARPQLQVKRIAN